MIEFLWFCRLLGALMSAAGGVLSLATHFALGRAYTQVTLGLTPPPGWRRLGP